MLYIGCPAWGFKEWVGNFFPARTPASEFLKLYSQRLTTVEGNTVFYALPTAETVARWREETPSAFRFCPKVSRGISHASQLASSRDETLVLVERMRGLGSRLGPMFLQLPPAFGPAQLPELAAFLNFWPSDARLAVEVRHAGFYKEPYAEALDSLIAGYNVARVMMDTRPIRTGPAKEQATMQARERKPNLPLQIAITTDFTFVRYIGHPRMEDNEPFLDGWAQQLGQWLSQGLTLYVFCHCPFEVHSPDICAALYERVQRLVTLPDLPWKGEKVDEDEGEVEQGRLF